MKDDWEFTLYAVADRVHLPIYRLKAEMPMREFMGWLKYMQKPAEKPVDLATAGAEDLARMFG